MMEAIDGEEVPSTSATPSAVTKAPRLPPPEKPESRRTRLLVIASFWAVVIFLGIPVWLWTTSIHRARLPLDEMLSWAHGKACRLSFPLQIAIEAPQIPFPEASHLVRLTQHALDDHNEFSAHHLRLQLYEGSPEKTHTTARLGEDGSHGFDTAERDNGQNTVLSVRLIADEKASTAQASMPQHSTFLDIHYPPSQTPSVTSSASILSNFIAAQLEEVFREEQAMLEYILTAAQPASGSSGRQSKALNLEMRARLAKRRKRALKYATTYHLTFSLFSATASPSDWEIEAAVSEYLQPLLRSLSVVSNFKVDTQVQLYAKFSPSTPAPEYDADAKVWRLRQEDLSSFINAAEWPLSPSIGAGPTLNFVLYVPNPANSPLVVKESHSTSWLIPQWGGVAILNGLTDQNRTQAPTSLAKGQMQPALLTFSHQLLSFLGAPSSPPSLPLRLQTLVRVQAASLLLSASSTMGSLANLTVALPSIAIPETVSAAVDSTLSHLRETCTTLKAGQFGLALEHARSAEIEAEKGFFEKSMVGQVYFPDEHKVAVYLPLLGPVGVPLLMSAVKEVKKLLAARRAVTATR